MFFFLFFSKVQMEVNRNKLQIVGDELVCYIVWMRGVPLLLALFDDFEQWAHLYSLQSEIKQSVSITSENNMYCLSK